MTENAEKLYNSWLERVCKVRNRSFRGIPHLNFEFRGAKTKEKHELNIRRRIISAKTAVFIISAPAESVVRNGFLTYVVFSVGLWTLGKAVGFSKCNYINDDGNLCRTRKKKSDHITLA